MSKYGVISDPCIRTEYGEILPDQYFPVFSPNIGEYGPEITPHWDTFHAVRDSSIAQLSTIIHEIQTKLDENPIVLCMMSF